MVEMCGRLAEVAGGVVAVAMPDGGCSAADLLSIIAARFPVIAEQAAAGRIRICVDDAIVGTDTIVQPTQAIALFPPVSGG